MSISVTSESIEQHFDKLSQRLSALPEAEEPPPTMLQVLGRSRREAYWQRLLVHFLTPVNAHGLDRSLLEHFLTGLSNHPDVEFSFSRLDLEDVEVEKEVWTDEGRPDAIIWSSENWFLCFELKVDSSEGADQTSRYVNVGSFDEIGLKKEEVPTDGHIYIYIAPGSAPEPEADQFTHVSWEWVASELQSFLGDSYGEYPYRTTVQLGDFIDTIRNELTMTEYQENRQEKVELAIEHYEPIVEVLDTLEDYTSDLQERWPDWFLEQSPEGWDENWRAPETSNTYLKAYRDNWAIDYAEDNISNSRFCVYWEFRTTVRHIGQSRIEHRIVVTGTDDQFKQLFRENFYKDDLQREAMSILADYQAVSTKDASIQEWDDNTYERIVTGEYRFETQNGVDFTRAVVEVFEDFRPIFDLISKSIPE